MIFDLGNLRERITVKWLKANGYEKGVWGSPDYYVIPPKDKHGHTKFIPERRSYARWKSNSFVWEKHDEDSGICITYFPKKFNKYVNAGFSSHKPHDAVLITQSYGEEIIKDLSLENIKYTQDLRVAEIKAFHE